jgi:AcrR family transcriptional regulator
VTRPLATTDEHLLAAADRVLMTEGPSGFTLARAAAVAGVSAATLVHRFGSKEALFLRLSQRWVASLDGELTACAAERHSPLARFREVALHGYRDLDNPDTAARQLAALAIDLQHDEMRELLHIGWGKVRGHLERHAADAVAAGELVGAPPPDRLARVVQAAMEGGCLAWSAHPEGSLVDRLSEDLHHILHTWSREEQHR